jgi:outer membrane lipoprotein-sorting protein
MKGLILCAGLIFSLLTASNAQYLSAKDSDPDALALLTKAGKVFSNGNAQVNFKLKTSFPGQESQTSEGILYQSGPNYRLELKDYHIISNGATRWVYLKGPNEANIYNESNGQDWISPQDFLQLHKSNELVFTLIANKPDGTSIIEVKPLKGKFDEYSKFTVGIKNGSLNYINALSSDGSRQELTITAVTNPATLDANKLFTFHPELYPGVYIEDLRLD